MRAVDPRLLREVPAARRFAVLCVLLALATAATIVAQAAILGHVVASAFLGHGTLSRLEVPLVALAAVSAGRGALAWAFESGGILAAAGTVTTLRARLLTHLVHARPGGIGALNAGDVAAAALEGADALEPYFARFLPQLVLGACVPPVLLVWVGWHDVTSLVVLLCTLPLIPVFGILIGRATERATMRRWQALSLLSAHFVDVVRGLPTLRAYRRGSAQTESIAEYTEDYRRTTMDTLKIAFLSAFALELAASLGTALVAAEIGIRLVDGRIALEPALAILVLAPELYAPLRAVSAQFHASADGLAAAQRLLELSDLEPAVAAPAAPVAAPDPAAEGLLLDELAVDYPGRGRVLNGVSLELRPGERVAVLGPSGSGKSTLLAALLRFVEPCAGTISAAGVDLREVDGDAWRMRIAWVPQRPLLEPGTVAAAVRLGAPDAPDAAVGAALRAAGAEPLAARLDDGVVTLSAGEQRRVALARALLREAPLLLLDEPTAHLDDDSAAHVVATIGALPRTRTVIVATHDVRVLAAVDRALELRGGVLRAHEATGAIA